MFLKVANVFNSKQIKRPSSITKIYSSLNINTRFYYQLLPITKYNVCMLSVPSTISGMILTT